MSNLYRQSQRDNSGVRLPWEPEETQLLLKLVETHGPTWSLMIRLHGAEGTESNMFKNRTTVALKDKAVNIKKKLIRVGEPVPEGFENGQFKQLSHLLNTSLLNTS